MLAEKLGKGLAKGWRKVGKGLANGWQRVCGFPATAPKLHCPNNKVLQCNSFGTDG